MANRKFKTYCKIIDYVDSVDSELAEILRGTCSDMALGSMRGAGGITFLMPQDKSYRKKIADLAYSDKVEDANKASDMLNALIIRDVFKSPSDWIAKKDDIPNALFPSQHVELDSVSGKDVKFKSGAVATLDTNFKDSSRRGNLAVWKLTGEIPVTKDKLATMKYTRKSKKTGGYDVTSKHSQSIRYKIALAVENAYAAHQVQARAGNSKPKDIYMKYTMSLVSYILHVRKDRELLYSKVLPLLSFDKIDFYLLVEPHKFGGKYLLDNSIISEWWTQKQSVDVKKTMQEVLDLIKSGTNALVYTNRMQVFDKLNEVRQHTIRYTESRPRGCVDQIAKDYSEFVKTNTIGGAGPVLPEALIDHYRQEPGLKLIQDELRYLTFGAFSRLEREVSFDMGKYNELLNMIGECLYAPTEEDRQRAQKLLNRNSIKYLIAPTEKVQEIKVFVNSTMFMYIPLLPSEAESLRVKNSIHRPSPENVAIFNIQKSLYIQHDRLFKLNGAVNKDILNSLRDLDVSTLDKALREELQRKLNEHA